MKKKKKSVLKKVSKWLLSIFLILVIALVSIPFLFKDKIVAMVSNTINNNVNAKVSFKETDLSLFRNFPNASLQIKNLAIVNKAPFLGDTLLYSEKLNINLKITELFKKANEILAIQSITTENGFVNIQFNKEGSGNYDIAIKNDKAVASNYDSALSLNINHYELKNFDFNYFDATSNMKLSLESMYHSGTGNFAEDVLDLKTTTDTQLSLNMENTNYLNKVAIKLDAVLGIDINNLKFTFKENTAYINQLPLKFDGFLQMNDEGQLYDITFKTPTSSFKNALALLPKQYAGNLKSIKTEGDFNIKGLVKGRYSDNTIPAFNIAINATNAMFKYADLPKAVENIHLHLKIINKTGLLEDTSIAFDNSSFTIDTDVFNASGHIGNISENTTIYLKANGKINLANLSKVYPVVANKKLEGILNAAITTNFDMNSIENGNYQNIKNKGNITLSKFKYKGNEVAKPFFIDNTIVNFNTNIIKLTEFKAKTGNSDLNIQGNLENFYGFLFKNQQLKGNFNLSSQQFKVDDFVSKEETTEQDTPTSALKIPSFLAISLHAKADKVVYDNINLNNVSGTLLIKDESVILNNVKSDAFGGHIGFSGDISTKANTPKFAMNLNLQELNISESFEKLNLLKTIAPIAKTIEGKFNSTFKISGNLNDDMTPILNSVSGDLLGKLLNTKINASNSKILSLVDSKVNFLDANKLNLNDVGTLLTFKDGKVDVSPFNITYKDINLGVKGSHGFDNQMNYNVTFDVPVKYLGDNITNAIAKLSAKDASVIKTVPVNALLTGSFSNPNFTTDLKQATTSLMNTIIEKQKQSLVNKGKDKLLNLLGVHKEPKKDSTKTTKNPEETVKEKAKNKLKDVLGGILGKKKE